MNEKTKETALEILQEMQKDKCVELSPDNLYFNKMCLGCKRNCITCIGFSLSCMIDNVIAVTEHASKDLWYTLDEYKKCRRFLRKRKKLNNGSLDVPFDNIEVIKSVCDIFNSYYSKMSLDDIMKIIKFRLNICFDFAWEFNINRCFVITGCFGITSFYMKWCFI